MSHVTALWIRIPQIIPRGPPGSECRMLTRLVSPAIGREKKMEPP